MSQPVTRAKRSGGPSIVPPVKAIGRPTRRELDAAFKLLRENDYLSVGGVIKADERVFSAGWDLREVASSSDADMLLGTTAKGGWAVIYSDLRSPSSRPSIDCDRRRIRAGPGARPQRVLETTELSLPEMQHGFLPAPAQSSACHAEFPATSLWTFWSQDAGRRRAAAEAYRRRLVNLVVPSSEVLPRSLVRSKSAKGSARPAG